MLAHMGHRPGPSSREKRGRLHYITGLSVRMEAIKQEVGMAPYKPLPSLQRLREAFWYEPDSGLLFWRISRGSTRDGSVAGTPRNNGYLQVKLDQRIMLVHRVAWFLYYEEDPEGSQIDHIDGNKANNRIGNLRLATCSQNHHNLGVYSTNTSGYKGVSWCTTTGRWQTHVSCRGLRYTAGYHDAVEDAY